MATYTTRPRTVEALQLTPDTFRKILDWLPDDLFVSGGTSDIGLHIVIRTTSGRLTATEGDWVVETSPSDFEVHTPNRFTARYTA